MSNYDEDRLKKVIEKIAKKENFSDNVKILFSKGKEKGEGYMGNILKINIKEEPKTLSVIAKVSLKHESIRAITPIQEAYRNEIQFYEKIFPTLDDLQKNKHVLQLFDSVPRFFASGSEEEFIILENVKDLGFQMFDLKEDLDGDHCKLICETFGKFHALSFALKYLKPEKYYKLIEGLHNIHLNFMRYKGGLIKICFTVIQSFLNEISKSNRLIDHYVENVENVFRNILSESKNDANSCILHCDGWSNNFLFKYSQSKEQRFPVSMKLLDWQDCYFGSPVQDLSYAIYAGASKNVLDDLDSYLKIYHNTLTNVLDQMSLNVERIYSFQIFKDQWKKYCEFGVVRGLMVTKIKLTDTTNLPDVSDSEENFDAEYFEKIIRAECDKEKLYKRIVDLFEHLETIGVF